MKRTDIQTRDDVLLDRRLIGAHTGRRPGPSVICVGGLHGNEWAGIAAIRRVLIHLETASVDLAGEFIGFAGNLQALAADQRYLSNDLNRVWTEERVEAIRRGLPVPDEGHERSEQCALLAHLDHAVANARGLVCFLDLHTSSAAGEPFICFSDTLRNRAFALPFAAPIILGLEETIDGALSEYMTRQGHISLAVEGGQHGAVTSIDHHEAAIWTALEEAGCLPRGLLPIAEELRHGTREAARHVPPILELISRHSIAPEDQFKMELGYRNFQRVQRDELLATDRHGEIRAPSPARILLPLYQAVGSDGFFLAREVQPVWLRVSRIMRRLHLCRLAPLLPGVSAHPENSDWLRVDPSVARWYAYDIFHLLGYRKKRAEGDHLIVERRRHDLHRNNA
jgi:succinylglutamate desuccinylase